MIEKVKAALEAAYPGLAISARTDSRGIVTLTGECDTWEQVVGAGHRAAKVKGVRNVVNDLRVQGQPTPQKDWSQARAQGEALGVTHEADVLIIGGGIIGCAIARELSRFKLRILLAEMTEDVAAGATKANNGNIHPGHAVKPGTLKARLNVEGNRMYTDWARELGFALERCGAMGFITEYSLLPALLYSLRQAQRNRVDGARLVSGSKARALEPGLGKTSIGKRVKAALWLPSMGLVEPYKVCVALAENAAGNGVQFLFNCTVADILTENGKAAGAVTSQGIIRARYIVNCAGVYADEISAMAGDRRFTIHPRKGVIAILDQRRAPVYQSLCQHVTWETVKKALRPSQSKGGGMCHTPEGNILMGPSAKEVPDKEDRSTSREELAYAMSHGAEDGVSYGDIIRVFAGVRPADYKEDFIIEQSPVTSGFINVGAIQSPGLAAAPAIAAMAIGILRQEALRRGEPFPANPAFQPIRKQAPAFGHLSREEQDALIRQDPRYGKIVCRCETITEGEILEALRSPIPPMSLDAVKRRVRAGMGRCQGGFCQPRVLEILARELGRDMAQVNLREEGTAVLVENTRPKKEAAP